MLKDADFNYFPAFYVVCATLTCAMELTYLLPSLKVSVDLHLKMPQ